jgi:putative membrane protein
MARGRTLVLCVDRDDDIGFKGNISSPLIGRAACLEAANTLALADPEDSDINALFQAVKTYDELVHRGEEVAIAILAGDHMHMIDGDRRIAAGLDQVVKATGADNCILISDGVEDEYVLPIIQSRIPVSSVRRVIVSQIPNLEGTYYIIKKLFDDPKISRVVLVPLGLAMLLFALAYLVSRPEYAMIIVIGVIGIYLLVKGFGLDEVFRYFTDAIRSSFQQGRFTFVAYVSAILLITLGVVMGLFTLITYYTGDRSSGIFVYMVTFVYGSVGWLTIAGLIASGGKIIDTYIDEWESIGRVIVLPFFIAAIGIIAYGSSVYTLSMSEIANFPFTPTVGVNHILYATIGGLLCATLGMYIRSVVQRLVIERARVIGEEKA